MVLVNYSYYVMKELKKKGQIKTQLVKNNSLKNKTQKPEKCNILQFLLKSAHFQVFIWVRTELFI